jgi:hypothetical protein
MRPAYISAVIEQEFSSTQQGYHTPVMIWGPPGVGKSQIVAQVAENHGAALVDIRLSQMEPSDLRGIPFKNGAKVEWAIPAMLPEVAVHGEAGLLFIDEITSAPPSVSAAAYQLILDRRLGEYRVPEHWAIVAAGNRQGDRGVTYNMPAPLANRFSHYEVSVNLDDWAVWAYRNRIDERIIAFLRFRPDLLFDFNPEHNPVAFPSPRSWEFSHRALHKFAGHPQLLQGGLEACVGKAAGVELYAFIQSVENLPDIDAIARGESRECPDEIDLQYAVATSLVTRAVRADGDAGMLGHILDYATAFKQREMGVMLVSDLHRATGAKLFAVPQFANWAEQIGDILVS